MVVSKILDDKNNYNVFNSSRLNSSKCEKAKRIIKIALTALLSITLAWINPATFLISFIVGVAFSKSVQKAVDRIKGFISHYKWPVMAGCAIMAFFTLPVFIATASAAWSAYLGSYLSKGNQKK